MNKRAGRGKSLAVLLDSTYLLPVFGIEVKGISSEDMLKLRSLALRGLIRIYYSPISILEVVSKVAREARRKGEGPSPEEIEAIIQAIEDAEYLEPLHPNSRAYALAYKMKLLGHSDMIDNLLYATASMQKLVFVTLDEKLRNFIQNHGIEGASLISHSELLEHY